MRVAIISDIHSNYVSLEAVFCDIDQQNVDQIICLGDIVGYGPAPNECVDLVRERADVCLMGNHDAAAAGLDSIETFNVFAKDAILWTQKVLTEMTRDYLSGLPFVHTSPDAVYVHSSPDRPEEWNYIVSVYDAQNQFLHFGAQVCFVGHTHVGVIFVQNQFSHKISREKTRELNQNERYIINVGAVGQPRDYDSAASYGIWDTDSNKFVYRRIEYDIPQTQFQMEQAGLPQYLIERLGDGR